MSPVGTIMKLTDLVVGGAFRMVRGAASVVTGIGQPAGSSPRPGEQVTTEPHSPSRDADHGGPGADRIDDWRDEVAGDESVETSVGTTGAGRGINPATGRPDPDPGVPGVDSSLTKAVKKEAERMHKASEPKKS